MKFYVTTEYKPIILIIGKYCLNQAKLDDVMTVGSSGVSDVV